MGTEQTISLVDVLSAIGDARQQESNDDDELIILTDWTVRSDGRLTIPDDKREKYGIEEGDDLDGLLLVTSE